MQGGIDVVLEYKMVTRKKRKGMNMNTTSLCRYFGGQHFLSQCLELSFVSLGALDGFRQLFLPFLHALLHPEHQKADLLHLRECCLDGSLRCRLWGIRNPRWRRGCCSRPIQERRSDGTRNKGRRRGSNIQHRLCLSANATPKRRGSTCQFSPANLANACSSIRSRVRTRSSSAMHRSFSRCVPCRMRSRFLYSFSRDWIVSRGGLEAS